MPPVSQPTKHYSAALPWLEFFLGLVGFSGLTYFVLGKPIRGLLWLIVDIIKHSIGVPLVAVTLGLALGCIIPLNVLISIFVTIHVSRTIHLLQHPHLAHLAHQHTA